MGGQVAIISDEYTHALVRQSMDEVQKRYKEIGNPDKEEIVIIQDLSGIPRNYENAPGDNDAEKLSKAMEQWIAVQA